MVRGDKVAEETGEDAAAGTAACSSVRRAFHETPPDSAFARGLNPPARAWWTYTAGSCGSDEDAATRRRRRRSWTSDRRPGSSSSVSDSDTDVVPWPSDRWLVAAGCGRRRRSAARGTDPDEALNWPNSSMPVLLPTIVTGGASTSPPTTSVSVAVFESVAASRSAAYCDPRSECCSDSGCDLARFSRFGFVKTAGGVSSWASSAGTSGAV